MVVVEPLTAADWPDVARIYAAGIATGNATFEHLVPEWEVWSGARISRPRLVARACARARATGAEGASVVGGASVAEGAEGASVVGGASVAEGAEGASVAGGVEGKSVAGGPGGALVAEGGAEVIGWAALSPTSSRPVYRGVGSVSIYVDPTHAGRGVGGLLLARLIEESERAGIWTLEAGIFPENTASIALHERCGFRLVGVRERVGQMQDGRWRDVLLYERRSK